MRIFLWPTAALSVLLFASSFAMARSAKLTFLTGKITVLKDGKETKASLGYQIETGDIVKTQADSTAILTVDDGSQLKLNQNSELSLGGDPKATEVALNSGSVFSKVPKQTAGRRFYVRTKSAVMGVRGTQFFTAFGKQKDTPHEDLWMCVKEGSVEIESLKNKKKVLVKEGEGVLVEKGSEISPPKAYSWTKSLNWNLDPNAGSIEEKGSIDSAYKNIVEQDYD